MGPLLLAVEDWDTINSLCFDRKVLQLGFHDGRDTVSIARSAHNVTVSGVTREETGEQAATHLGQLYTAVFNGGCGGHVIIHSATWQEATSVYCPDQFDVAVISPGALGGELLDNYLLTAQAMATDLVVIEPHGADSWAAVTRLCPRPYWSTTKSGRVVVSRNVTATNPAEAERD